MDRRTKFYLDKRNGKLMGVCSGLGDYLGVDPIWVRVAAVVGAFTGGWSVLIYFVVAFAADDKPRALYDDDAEERAFWRRVRVAPQRSIRDVHSTFRNIDRRLADVERHYTSSNSRLAAEIDRLR